MSSIKRFSSPRFMLACRICFFAPLVLNPSPIIANKTRITQRPGKKRFGQSVGKRKGIIVKRSAKLFTLLKERKSENIENRPTEAEKRFFSYLAKRTHLVTCFRK